MSTKAKKKIRIMLVEDHILIRMGLVTASQLEPDIELVADVEVGEDAVECYRTHRPDVVIMDLRLPGMDGIQTITALRQEYGPVVVLVMSTYAADDDVYRAIQAGASGYILKDMPLKSLVEAIRAVHAGQSYFPPGISDRLAERLRQAVPTDRELLVLQKIAKGMSNKEIGNELGITEGTVKAHVTNILSKLHAADRTQAVTTAIKRGMIHID
ncbi:MAG TPA: response regulator transcription factor [Candidatus Angelobacter sp.]|nr:response regulator transcription factor [Candidatus Angelobacter sp.]